MHSESGGWGPDVRKPPSISPIHNIYPGPCHPGVRTRGRSMEDERGTPKSNPIVNVNKIATSRNHSGNQE